MTLALQWFVPADAAVPPVGEGALAALPVIIGPPGTSGNAAGRYEHVQASASALWTVNHNLGVKTVAVTVLTAGGVEVDADITHVSINQLTIAFAQPFAGTARIL